MLIIHKRAFLSAFTALCLVMQVSGLSKAGSSEVEIGTCEECADVADTSVLNGTLKALSFKASMLQLATSNGTSVVTFNDETILTGVEDLNSIKPGSNLEIEYLKKGGAFVAVGIDVVVAAPAVLASDEIDAETLAGLLSAKAVEVALIDARSVYSFEQEHIPGAISIYTGEFDNNLDKLPKSKNQLIVYYCDGTT